LPNSAILSSPKTSGDWPVKRRYLPLMAFGPTINLGNGRKRHSSSTDWHCANIGLRVNMTWIGKRIVIATLLLVAANIAYIEIRHRLTHGHFVPLGPHADILVHNASVGIAGVTKLYEGTLTNYGFLPLRVERCTYMSDTAEPGVMVAFNIEQWEPGKHEWTRAMEFAKPELCSPMVTSMGNTRWVHSWLWPGQMLATGEEATGARGFRKGDTLRFAIVTEVTGKSERRSSYPTPPFTLDEQSLDELPGYRIKH